MRMVTSRWCVDNDIDDIACAALQPYVMCRRRVMASPRLCLVRYSSIACLVITAPTRVKLCRDVLMHTCAPCPSSNPSIVDHVPVSKRFTFQDHPASAGGRLAFSVSCPSFDFQYKVHPQLCFHSPCRRTLVAFTFPHQTTYCLFFSVDAPARDACFVRTPTRRKCFGIGWLRNGNTLLTVSVGCECLHHADHRG